MDSLGKCLPYAVVIAAIFCGDGSFAAPLKTMDGVWMRGDGNARVRVAPCGHNICATNLWIKSTDKSEHVGDTLVMTLTPGQGDTLAGKAYDPQRHWTYSMSVTVSNDRMTTKGCLIGRLLCKSVSWTRTG